MSISGHDHNVGPGFYPPMMHQLALPEDREQWTSGYSMAHSVEAMAKIKGVGRAKKYNLMGQVIPIYGFGILLYILYIIYKLTCKGKTTKPGYYSTLPKENMETKIVTDYELSRLQKKLLETEKAMERIVSGKGHGHGSGRSKKSKTAVSKQEEKLLRQLRQITRVMQEGRVEGASPEMEAEQVPYAADWEGYPEETYPEYDEPFGSHDYDTIVLKKTKSELPTAEALAERMEQEEEEEVERKLDVVREEDKDEEEEEEEEVEEEEGAVVEDEEVDEEDPVMEAESLAFNCEVCFNPEEEAEEEEEESLLMSVPVEGDGLIQSDMAKEPGMSGLRMRNRRQT